MTKAHGFKDDCLNGFDDEIYRKFLEIFKCMPLAAVIENDEKIKSVFLLNGGSSQNLSSIQQIEEIQRLIKSIESDLVHEIIFSDPTSKDKNYSQNKKSNNYTYRSSVVHKFLKDNHLNHLIRSHQKDDFSYPFGKDHSLLSIYSGTGMNLYMSEDMLYTFLNRTNLNNYDEKNQQPCLS